MKYRGLLAVAFLAITMSITACGSNAVNNAADDTNNTAVEETNNGATDTNVSTEYAAENTDNSAAEVSENSNIAEASEDTQQATDIPTTFIGELDLYRSTIDYLPGFEPQKYYSSEIIEQTGINPFAIYDGYYFYSDAKQNGCNLKIKDGLVTIETRGEKSENITSEIYIQEDYAFVELDGEVVQLGAKDEYSLEYSVYGTRMPSYLTALTDADTAFYEQTVDRIVSAEQREAEEKQRELEEQKKQEEEELARLKAEEEAAKKAEEEKNAKLAQSRADKGWLKCEVDNWGAGQGYTEIAIKVIETNYPDLSAGDIIVISSSEFDSGVNDIGPILTDKYVTSNGGPWGYGTGEAFEAIIDKNGGNSYRIKKFLG